MSTWARRIAETATKLFAGIGKALGLYGAFLQLVIHAAHPSGVALAFSACLIAGAQTFEGLFLHFIDNLFDVGGPEQREEPSKDTSGRRRKGVS